MGKDGPFGLYDFIYTKALSYFGHLLAFSNNMLFLVCRNCSLMLAILVNDEKKNNQMLYKGDGGALNDYPRPLLEDKCLLLQA